MRREWIEIQTRENHIQEILASPSMRREWIEMSTVTHSFVTPSVSLHAEGVD